MSSAINKVGSFLYGGQSSKSTTAPGMSSQEQAREDHIDSQLNDSLDGQNSAYGSANSSFQDHLQQFLKASQSSNPTADEMNQATNYVDQTYTNPTQNAINQYNSQFESTQNAKAAAMGRNPNTDIASQQAIYGEGQRNAINLQANRASQIQQLGMGLNQQDYNRLGTGTNFLNGLTQQAFTNRMSMLNGLSGINNYYQSNRGLNQTQSSGGTSGLFGLAGGLLSASGAVQKAYNGQGASAPSPMPTSQSQGIGQSPGQAPSFGFLGGQ